jgi:hypothetical protein
MFIRRRFIGFDGRALPCTRKPLLKKGLDPQNLSKKIFTIIFSGSVLSGQTAISIWGPYPKGVMNNEGASLMNNE